MEKNQEYWFALRVTYSRELKFKDLLDSEKITNFVPMQYKIIRDERKLVPVIHNLIFACTTRNYLDRLKSGRPDYPVRYMMDCVSKEPLIVPDRQMDDFIRVAGTFDEGLVYLDSEELRIKRGDKVRIVAGPFAGVEGEFVRIRKDRRVVVRIEGLMAVATTFIDPSLVVKI